MLRIARQPCQGFHIATALEKVCKLGGEVGPVHGIEFTQCGSNIHSRLLPGYAKKSLFN